MKNKEILFVCFFSEIVWIVLFYFMFLGKTNISPEKLTTILLWCELVRSWSHVFCKTFEGLSLQKTLSLPKKSWFPSSDENNFIFCLFLTWALEKNVFKTSWCMLKDNVFKGFYFKKKKVVKLCQIKACFYTALTAYFTCFTEINVINQWLFIDSVL